MQLYSTAQIRRQFAGAQKRVPTGRLSQGAEQMAKMGARFGLTRYEADGFYQQALAAYEKKNLEEAILNVTSAIDAYPYNSEYHAARGLFYLQDGVYEQAGADFDEALRQHAYEMLANYGRGVLAYQADDYETALEFFLKAWASDQQRAETLYYVALTHHRLQDNEQALAWMQSAVDAFSADKSRQANRDARNAERWLQEFRHLQEQAEEAERRANLLQDEQDQASQVQTPATDDEQPATVAAPNADD